MRWRGIIIGVLSINHCQFCSINFVETVHFKRKSVDFSVSKRFPAEIRRCLHIIRRFSIFFLFRQCNRAQSHVNKKYTMHKCATQNCALQKALSRYGHPFNESQTKGCLLSPLRQQEKSKRWV